MEDALQAQIDRKNKELEIVQRVSMALNSHTDVPSIAKQMLGMMAHYFAFEHSMLLVLQANATHLEVIATHGYATENVGKTVKVGLGVVGMVAKKKKLMRMANLGTQRKYMQAVRNNMMTGSVEGEAQSEEIAGLPDVESQVAIPLMVEERLMGVLSVESPKVNVYNPADEKIISILASLGALALQNAYYLEKERREAERNLALTRTFEKFVPREFLNRIATGGVEHIRLGSTHSDTITMLFSDIRSFTTLSETMTPSQLVAFLNNYLALMNESIHLNRGFVDKFIGDAIMALYDLPDSSDAEEATGALRSAIGMQQSLMRYNQERVAAGYAPVLTGIGIHSGEVIIGTVGSEQRMDSTVLGDAVNLASRLEGLTKPYGAKVLASDATHGLVAEQAEFQWRELDRVTVKGKTRPVGLFELLSADPPELLEQKQATLALFEEGRAQYRQQRWQASQQAFEECLRLFPDDAVPPIYLARIREFQITPPPADWDGATCMTSK
jgi:adenylate cyclase